VLRPPSGISEDGDDGQSQTRRHKQEPDKVHQLNHDIQYVGQNPAEDSGGDGKKKAKKNEKEEKVDHL
jgi:hypothetical protein